MITETTTDIKDYEATIKITFHQIEEPGRVGRLLDY